MNYNYPFVNQYIKIPKEVSDKVELLYPKEKIKVKYCISMIITNLLARGEISYTTRGTYFKRNHTEYYNKPSFMSALSILIRDGYARKSKKGSRNIKFPVGISSRIKPYTQITIDFGDIIVPDETDIPKFPYLEGRIPVCGVNSPS